MPGSLELKLHMVPCGCWESKLGHSEEHPLGHNRCFPKGSDQEGMQRAEGRFAMANNFMRSKRPVSVIVTVTKCPAETARGKKDFVLEVSFCPSRISMVERSSSHHRGQQKDTQTEFPTR